MKPVHSLSGNGQDLSSKGCPLFGQFLVANQNNTTIFSRQLVYKSEESRIVEVSPLPTVNQTVRLHFQQIVVVLQISSVSTAKRTAPESASNFVVFSLVSSQALPPESLGQTK